MTTRIGLITTGKCEQAALAPSLARCFAEANVQFELCFKTLVDSFTSAWLSYPAPPEKIGETLVDRFVASIAAELQRRGAPDFIFAIDDLELANLETPHNVVALVRDAVLRVCRGATHRDLESFRERAAVHFLCPMVEAYFFGEAQALARAGATREAFLMATRNLEAFTSTDIAYLGTTDQQRHPWRTADRARHPKRYIKYLNDPEDQGLRGYRETKQGAAALAALDWQQVFAREPRGLFFAHSLFDDLADAIGSASPFPGECHPLTQRKQGGVLRNL